MTPARSDKAGERFGSLRRAVAPARLLLAGKTALAVGLAWAIAPHLPGVTDEHPYYAPLGALVSMYPTFMESVKSGVQTLLGLGTGIALALLVVVTVGPTWWSVPIVAALGVLAAGTGWYGAGQEYVPIAALFVLIIGGQNSDSYSLSYLAEMAVGVAVGLAVNMLIVPGTMTAAARNRIGVLRDQLAGHLREMGEAMSDSWPPRRSEWSREAAALADTSRDVRRFLADAETSSKRPSRVMRMRGSTARAYRDLEALERIAVLVREISELFADAAGDRPGGLRLDAGLAGSLSEACRDVAACVADAGANTPDAHRSRQEAARSLRLVIGAIDERSTRTGRSIGSGALMVMHLRRVLLLSRPAG